MYIVYIRHGNKKLSNRASQSGEVGLSAGTETPNLCSRASKKTLVVQWDRFNAFENHLDLSNLQSYPNFFMIKKLMSYVVYIFILKRKNCTDLYELVEII